jgi:hypothetical protein
MSRVTFTFVTAVVVLVTLTVALRIPLETFESMEDWAEKVALEWSGAMRMLCGDFSG